MFFVYRGTYPSPFQWSQIGLTSLFIPLLVIANHASFDLEKSLSTSCDRHCFNGVCLNGSCVCSKGWVGSQCDHCYGRIKVTENHSHLIDGPLDYSPSSKCTWLIESEKKVGAPLNIRLESFQTECGWDFVYIYDGDGVYGEQLAAFCGDQEVHELSAPSGKALIYFFSDLAMNLSGFNITYEFEKCPYNCNSRGSCTNSTCVCNEGYTGAYCDTRICTERDEGRPGPCLHGGTCRHSRCSCPPSFHGETCQVETVQSVWDRIPALNAPAGRASHASVMVDDTIWSIGGEHFNGVVFNDPVVFNITSRSWKTVEVGGTTKPAPRFDHTIVRYKSKLMMFGGVIERKNITNELWSLDLHKKVWKKESDENNDLMVPPLAVSGHTAHVIGSEMFVFFGYHPEIGFVHNVQIYNFETGKWRFGNTKDQVYGRFRHTSVHFKMDSGDAVLVYGGTMWSNSQNNLTDSLMRYDVKFEKWTNLPPSGVQLFLHTATILNGLMIVVGGNGYNISESRAKQECFSSMIQAYDIACKQWFNISSGAAQLRRYGHSAVATSSELYIIGGFNGKMLNDVWRFSPAECSSATRPEECRSLSDGVKCVFADRACVKFDPFVSYKQSFLSFVKNESPTKLMSECRNTATRQALQVCEEQTDCMSCISEPACGWCPSGDQCLPNDGECVDGQVMQTTWEKCSLSRDPPPPRPCGMANDCRSCKLLPHCNWYTVEGKPACIPLEDEILLRKEQLDRELDRVASSSLPLRLPATPPPIPPGQNLSYCPLACSSLYTCSDCLQDQKCMWCPSTARCINMEAYALSFAYGQCHSWVAGHAHGLAFSKSCRLESSNCSSHKTCAECQLSPECGWLDDGSRTGLGTCTRGSSRGPLEPSPNFHPKQWFFIDCPACQCNGHSMCNETRNTLGGVQEVCGECQDNTMGKHCELCAPGFHGDPRNGGNCTACQCNGQADSCDGVTGYCHCRSKGVSGASCDRCDKNYYGQPRNGTPCYYELNVDFVFTFKLKNEDKDKHVTDIYLFSIPRKKDTDVTFQISCDGSQANVALNITSSLFESTPRRMMLNTTCDAKGFRRVYVASDPDYAYGTDANTTFFVRVFNFTTPITIQISFAQSPPINWVLFFVIFAACFIVLLVVAGLLWMIKLRIEVYRRNQRRIDEIEHMASRPFSSVKLELTNPHCFAATGTTQGPTPLSVEPCSNYKSGIFTLAVRLPTGGRATTPNGTSGLAVASALCLLTPALLGVLQAPDNSENRNNRKTTLRSYIPFLRTRLNDSG